MNSTLYLFIRLTLGFVLYFSVVSTVYALAYHIYPTRYNGIIILFYIIFAAKIIINHCNNIHQDSEEERKTDVKNPVVINIEAECVICLDNISRQNIVYDLGCQHVFHKQCIDKWVHYGSTCPLCRNDIIVE